MISAPASIAARATAALLVSIEIGTLDLRCEAFDDGQHATQFFVGVDGFEYGRVLSPPMSRMSAPSATSCSA